MSQYKPTEVFECLEKLTHMIEQIMEKQYDMKQRMAKNEKILMKNEDKDA